MATSEKTIKWVENLADQEIRIYSGEKASLDLTVTKDKVLSVDTTTFMRDLFFHFEYLIQLFNFRIKNTSVQIKLTKTDNLETFFLVRHQMKLMAQRKQLGAIMISCEKMVSEEKATLMFTGAIEARFGTFHDVEWNFLGSKVTAEQVARHYLTEFVQVSRNQ